MARWAEAGINSTNAPLCEGEKLIRGNPASEQQFKIRQKQTISNPGSLVYEHHSSLSCCLLCHFQQPTFRPKCRYAWQNQRNKTFRLFLNHSRQRHGGGGTIECDSPAGNGRKSAIRFCSGNRWFCRADGDANAIAHRPGTRPGNVFDVQPHGFPPDSAIATGPNHLLTSSIQ